MDKSKNFTRNVVRCRYSLLEVPCLKIHNLIAKAMSICVAVGNKVMDTRLPLPVGSGDKYDVSSGVQYGRSMIEMLGVLAIIAVLSVGGIAGYSKAMSSFKHNKWLYQIETLIFNIKEMYKSQGQYGKAYGSGGQDENIVPVLRSTGALSAEMLDSNNKDLFGNRVFIYIRTWNGWIRPHIQFDMPAGSDAVENCKNLFRLPVEEQSIWSVEFCKGANCWDNWVYRLCGKSAPIEYINRGEKCEVATYNLSKVINSCKVCKSQPCTLLVIFDNNV